MCRFLILAGCCLALAPLHLAQAAASIIYAATPSQIIVPTSTSTFQSLGVVQAAGGGGYWLSPDGNTFYGFAGGNQIIAFDHATGRTLHTYQTQHPLLGVLAILPNESQIYVSTCEPVTGFPCGNTYVEVLDVASGQELATISMGTDQVWGLAAAPNSATVYVAHAYYGGSPGARTGSRRGEPNIVTGSVTAIDVATLQVGGSFSCPGPDYPDPYSMVISPDSSTGYLLAVADYSSYNTYVYVVDLTQMAITATLVPPPPPPTSSYGGALVLSGDGSTLAVYLNGAYSSELLFFNTATQSVTQTAPGVNGYSFSISPDGSTVDFVTFGINLPLTNGGNLDTVDARTGTVNTVVTSQSIDQALLSPNGRVIYLVKVSGSGVREFWEGYTQSRLFDVGEPSAWLAVSPNGQTLYSANGSGVWAVSTVTGAVTSKLLQGTSVDAIAISPTGSTLYALSAGSFSFLIVNLSTGAVENTIALPKCTTRGTLTGSMAMAPGGWAFVVVDSFQGTCAVVPINLKTLTVEPAISGTNGPELAVSPGGGFLWTGAGSSIDVIDLAHKKLAGTVPISANSVVFSPDGKQAYVAGSQNSVAGVGVVDTSTFAVTNFIAGSIGSGGESIAITRDGKFVFVAGGAVISTASLSVVGQFGYGPPIVIH